MAAAASMEENAHKAFEKIKKGAFNPKPEPNPNPIRSRLLEEALMPEPHVKFAQKWHRRVVPSSKPLNQDPIRNSLLQAIQRGNVTPRQERRIMKYYANNLGPRLKRLHAMKKQESAASIIQKAYRKKKAANENRAIRAAARSITSGAIEKITKEEKERKKKLNNFEKQLANARKAHERKKYENMIRSGQEISNQNRSRISLLYPNLAAQIGRQKLRKVLTLVRSIPKERTENRFQAEAILRKIAGYTLENVNGKFNNINTQITNLNRFTVKKDLVKAARERIKQLRVEEKQLKRAEEVEIQQLISNNKKKFTAAGFTNSKQNQSNLDGLLTRLEKLNTNKAKVIFGKLSAANRIRMIRNTDLRNRYIKFSTQFYKNFANAKLAQDVLNTPEKRIAERNKLIKQRLETLMKELNNTNNKKFYKRYNGLGLPNKKNLATYFPNKKREYNTRFNKLKPSNRFKAALPKFRSGAKPPPVFNEAAARNALRNYLTATVKPKYNNALVNAMLRLPNLNNATRQELKRSQQSRARRVAGALGRGAVAAGGALGRGAVAAGGALGRGAVAAGRAAITALTRSKIQKAMFVMKNPKSTYKEQAEALKSLRSIMSNVNATMENRNAAYQAFKNLGRNNSLGFKPRNNQSQSPPEGYNYKNNGIYGPGFYLKTTAQPISTQTTPKTQNTTAPKTQNTTAPSKLGPVNNKIENALSSSNRYTRLERLYELYKSYKNDPDAKRRIIRQIRIIIAKLYGYNVSSSNAIRNIGNANKMLRGKVSVNVNKNLNRARATLKSGKRSTYTRSSNGGYYYNRGRAPNRIPAAALPAAALPAAALPAAALPVGAAQPPVSISISNIGKVSNVGKVSNRLPGGNMGGGGLGVSAPSASGTRTLNATSEQLIRNAGGNEAIENGIKALRAANGNVTKAKAISKLPSNTFTNIYALGGPVAAKKLVESRRRRQRVGVRRSLGRPGVRGAAAKKKRVAQKPRKKYIKLTPYQFKRLTDHIKKNNLRRVLIKEITH
jgi:hypothetical protein